MRLLFLAIVMVCMCTVSSAQAQSPYASRPRVSPYLNLVRPGATPSLNYYGQVRPQLFYYQQLNQQQQAIGRLGNQVSAFRRQGDEESESGHPTYFLNYFGYFNLPARR